MTTERKMREVTERDLRAVARFLRMTPGLSRKVIGDMLGENCDHCKRLLLVFSYTFEFKGAQPPPCSGRHASCSLMQEAACCSCKRWSVIISGLQTLFLTIHDLSALP